MTLGSDSPTNTPDAFKSEWTIAALPRADQKLTYATSWNGAPRPDGSDIYGSFSSTGRCRTARIDDSNSAGAVAVAVPLESGQETTVRFALSWDFPQVYYGNSRGAGARAVWMRRYTEFLGATATPTNDYVPGSYPFKQAFKIATRELARHDDSLSAVSSRGGSRSPRTRSTRCGCGSGPERAVRDGLQRLLLGGRPGQQHHRAHPRRTSPGRGDHPGTHLFYTIDAGSGGAAANEIDVDSAGYLAYTKLFPNLELGRVRAWLQLIKQNPLRACAATVHSDTGRTSAPPSPTRARRRRRSPPVFGAPPRLRHRSRQALRPQPAATRSATAPTR